MSWNLRVRTWIPFRIHEIFIYKHPPLLNVCIHYNKINIYVSEHQAGTLANIVDDYTGKKQKNLTCNHERNFTSPWRQVGWPIQLQSWYMSNMSRLVDCRVRCGGMWQSHLLRMLWFRLHWMLLPMGCSRTSFWKMISFSQEWSMQTIRRQEPATFSTSF